MSGRAPAVTEEQVQEDLMRLEAYRNQLNQLLQQHQLLAGSRSDHDRARETLESFDRIDAHREIVIPLGAEAYVRGTASGDAPILLGIGSGVVAEVDRPKAIEILHARVERLNAAGSDLTEQIGTLEERIELLSQRLDQLSRGVERGGAAASDDVGRD
ncbi:MAG: prefoldin subunit alpha [Thermoplasmata archaeon]